MFDISALLAPIASLFCVNAVFLMPLFFLPTAPTVTYLPLQVRDGGHAHYLLPTVGIYPTRPSLPATQDNDKDVVMGLLKSVPAQPLLRERYNC